MTDQELFPRRKTRQIRIGDVLIGGGAPISVQSMTKTDTRDVRATVAQIRRLEKAGCEIVRLAVPDARRGLGPGRDPEEGRACRSSPTSTSITGWPSGPGRRRGRAADQSREHRLRRRRCARSSGPPRSAASPSGSGSTPGRSKRGSCRGRGATAEAMVESALRHIRMLEDLGFFAIKVSLKASDIPRTLEAYRLLAARVDYPFHAGITEAGGLEAGSVKSAAGLALLIGEGLADTIRVSLTAPPEKEVVTAWRLLRDLGLRSRGLDIVSCPTCGRAEVDLMRIAAAVERRLAGLRGAPDRGRHGLYGQRPGRGQGGRLRRRLRPGDGGPLPQGPDRPQGPGGRDRRRPGRGDQERENEGMIEQESAFGAPRDDAAQVRQADGASSAG